MPAHLPAGVAKGGRESISPGCRLALRVVQRAKSTPDPFSRRASPRRGRFLDSLLGACRRAGTSSGRRCQRGSGVDFARMPVGTTGRSAGEIDSRPLFAASIPSPRPVLGQPPRSQSENRHIFRQALPKGVGSRFRHDAGWHYGSSSGANRLPTPFAASIPSPCGFCGPTIGRRAELDGASTCSPSTGPLPASSFPFPLASQFQAMLAQCPPSRCARRCPHALPHHDGA